jgi:hypothetical protein
MNSLQKRFPLFLPCDIINTFDTIAENGTLKIAELCKHFFLGCFPDGLTTLNNLTSRHGTFELLINLSIFPSSGGHGTTQKK